LPGDDGCYVAVSMGCSPGAGVLLPGGRLLARGDVTRGCSPGIVDVTRGRAHPGVRVWLPGAVAARRRLLPGGDPRDSLPGDEELCREGKNPTWKEKKG